MARAAAEADGVDVAAVGARRRISEYR